MNWHLWLAVAVGFLVLGYLGLRFTFKLINAAAKASLDEK